MQKSTPGRQASADRGAVTYPLPEGVMVERNVRVRMRDGIHLSVTVWRPSKTGRFPVVMCMTAYGDFRPDDARHNLTLSKLMHAGLAVGTLNISDETPWEAPDPGFWVPNGYVVVAANARGFYDSEGQPSIYSAKDVEDYTDVIEWAGIQPWSNGAVGLNGSSYLAMTQWMVASQAKPSHLKAIIPWEGAVDSLRDTVQQGGIPETRFVQGWLRGSLARGAGTFIVTEGPAMIEHLMRHPFPLENIDTPALVCGSWSNHGLHSRGSIEGFMRISSRQKWLFTHGRLQWETYYSPEALEWQKSFFDHFLKGEDNGFERRPPVRLEIRRTKEEFEVRGESSWPPDNAKFTRRYLDLEHESLSPEARHKQQSRSYDAESKQTVEFNLSFDRRTEVTGSMMLNLWVSAKDADDLDLYVAIRKLDREGREVHFCGKDGVREGVVALGWLRVSQRHQDPERSKPWRPFLSHDRSEKVQPGEVVPVEIEILPSSTLFEPGESLRLVVSGHEILEQARFGHDETVNKGRHELYAGGPYPSHLLIPFC
jgi:predicted acyl esterase